MRHTNLKHISAIFALMVLTSMILVSIAHAEKWDMPMAYSDSNFHTQNAKAFAEAVKLATGGKLEIIIHGGGSLFKGNEIKHAVQTGQVSVGERLLSAHENENALFGADSIPFLATSYAESTALWKVIKPKLNKLLQQQNLILLYSVPWPAQGFYFNKAVDSIADVKGIKFRSYNAATNQLAELMGMNPVQIEAAELVQALVTGVAEAFVSSSSTGYDRKVWEHLGYFYDVQGWMPRNYVFVNKTAWNALDQATRNIVSGVALMAEIAGTAKSEQLMNWHSAQLAANGMKVQSAGEQLAAELKQIGAAMTASWIRKAGTQGQAIVNDFKTR